MNPRDEVKDAPPAPPTNCPSCRGRNLTTTAKAIDKNTYWRCLGCGEVWNLARRQSDRSHAFPTYGSFHR